MTCAIRVVKAGPAVVRESRRETLENEAKKREQVEEEKKKLERVEEG